MQPVQVQHQHDHQDLRHHRKRKGKQQLRKRGMGGDVKHAALGQNPAQNVTDQRNSPDANRQKGKDHDPRSGDRDGALLGQTARGKDRLHSVVVSIDICHYVRPAPAYALACGRCAG